MARVDGVRNARVLPVPGAADDAGRDRTSRRPGRTASSPATSGAPPRPSCRASTSAPLRAAEGLPGRRPRQRRSCARASTSIRELRIDTPDGGQVRLGDVASVAIAPNPVDLRHDAVSRASTSAPAVSGRGRRRRRADVRDRLRAMHFPLEYHAEVVTPPGRRAVAAVGLPRPRGGRCGRHLPAAPGRARQLAPCRRCVFATLPTGAGGRPAWSSSPAAATSARRGVRPLRCSGSRCATPCCWSRHRRSSSGEPGGSTRRSRARAGRPARAGRADGADDRRARAALRGARRPSPATRSPIRRPRSSSAGWSPRPLLTPVRPARAVPASGARRSRPRAPTARRRRPAADLDLLPGTWITEGGAIMQHGKRPGSPARPSSPWRDRRLWQGGDVDNEAASDEGPSRLETGQGQRRPARRAHGEGRAAHRHRDCRA